MVANNFCEGISWPVLTLWWVFVGLGLASHARGSVLLVRVVLSWFSNATARRRRSRLR